MLVVKMSVFTFEKKIKTKTTIERKIYYLQNQYIINRKIYIIHINTIEKLYNKYSNNNLILIEMFKHSKFFRVNILHITKVFQYSL